MHGLNTHPDTKVSEESLQYRLPASRWVNLVCLKIFHNLQQKGRTWSHTQIHLLGPSNTPHHKASLLSSWDRAGGQSHSPWALNWVSCRTLIMSSLGGKRGNFSSRIERISSCFSEIFLGSMAIHLKRMLPERHESSHLQTFQSSQDGAQKNKCLLVSQSLFLLPDSRFLPGASLCNIQETVFRKRFRYCLSCLIVLWVLIPATELTTAHFMAELYTKEQNLSLSPTPHRYTKVINIGFKWFQNGS